MVDRYQQLREEYEGIPFDESVSDPDPFVQFTRWFDAAVAENLPLANGMTLATVAADGRPSARIVLLKGADERGFVFYSNYDSRKGRELAANPKAALVLWWQPLHRQIRIEGDVEHVDAKVSDAYFAGRPRASNVSAIASPQSSVIADRAALESRVADVEGEYPALLPRPDYWGGYRVVPTAVEFWQGRADRLHDRLHYRRDRDRWIIERLCP